MTETLFEDRSVHIRRDCIFTHQIQRWEKTGWFTNSEREEGRRHPIPSIAYHTFHNYAGAPSHPQKLDILLKENVALLVRNLSLSSAGRLLSNRVFAFLSIAGGVAALVTPSALSDSSILVLARTFGSTWSVGVGEDDLLSDGGSGGDDEEGNMLENRILDVAVAVTGPNVGTEIPGGLEAGEEIWIAGTTNGHPGKLPPIAGNDNESGRAVGLGPGRDDLG